MVLPGRAQVVRHSRSIPAASISATSSPALKPVSRCAAAPDRRNSRLISGRCADISANGGLAQASMIGKVGPSAIRCASQIDAAAGAVSDRLARQRRADALQLTGRAEHLVLVRDVVGIGRHEGLARRARVEVLGLVAEDLAVDARTRPAGRRCRCSPWSRPAWRPAGIAPRARRWRRPACRRPC